MKVTFDWLRDYCDPGLGLEELCERLTMGVAPLESTEPLPGGDTLLDLEITFNRGDLLGVLGVAREVSAITGAPLKLPDLSYPEGKGRVEEVASVEVVDLGLCPRYIARVVEGVKIGPSPVWMVRRLESVGLRSVNNVVDVTNFVCLEYGQPLHAFDLDRLAASRIIVRPAREGEEMVTLDEKRHRLDPARLMIADAESSIAIAGVMGGAESEVTPATTRLLLESASFHPASIRHSAKALGISTESSARFERGVAWEGVDHASRRAISLILKLAGGEARAGEIDVAAEGAGEPIRITLRFPYLNRLAGVEIDPGEAVRVLESLGCGVVSRDPGSVTVTAPGHRTDIGREADLIEEVLRIHGYDRVPDNPALACFPVVRNPIEEGRAAVQDLLEGFGYQEARTLAFAAPGAEENPSAWTGSPPLRVLDPVKPELGGLRRGLLQNLIAVKRTNLDRGEEKIRIFESGVVYLPAEGDELPEEKEVVGILADAEPLDLKGAVEAIVDAIGSRSPLQWAPSLFPLFRPDASWQCSGGERRIGILGVLSEAALGGADPRVGEVCGAELDLAAIVALGGGTRRFEPLPRLPGAQRDISVVVDETVAWGEVERVIRGLDDPLLREIRLFDLYRGKQIPEGKKNFAFSLTYRSDERTLSGEEVESALQRAIAAIGERLGGQLRS